ncbi:hypothetical protein K501DRAFT_282410 [Backusella circina FSU 941]|nr:hypothetical protein K501DRAFT_282410 [Backusella circina FSU 941]
MDQDPSHIITTVNQEMPHAALFSSENGFDNQSPMDYNALPSYTPHFEQPNLHVTTTPVVKSHQPMTIYTDYPYSQQQQQQQQQRNQQHHFQPDMSITTTTNNNMMHMGAMDIDYFNPAVDTVFSHQTNLQSLYSPSNNSVTTNSSIMMLDSLSPTSPTHLMSPIQPMDTFVTPSTHYHMMRGDMADNIYPENTIAQPQPLQIPNYSNGMVLNESNVQFPPMERKVVTNRQHLPRRHTVSTPYASGAPYFNKGKEPMIECNNSKLEVASPTTPPLPKSRKSLKAKRHRSMGKIGLTETPPLPPDASFTSLSAKLELWSHEQLLERVMVLEKERENAVAQNSIRKEARSLTDTEAEEDDEEEEITEVGPTMCKWENCKLELSSLDDLINHVKTDHIGSGKATYYCCWKDCPRKQKPFTKRHKMHNHLRTHTGERPFVCLEPDCGKRFSRPDSLVTHAKIHSNIRPHLCAYENCGKAYYHLRSLRKHERTHQAESISAVSPSTTMMNTSHTPLSCPPIPIPSDVVHSAGLQPELVPQHPDDAFSTWAMSAQAAVFEVMDRHGNGTSFQ